MSEPRRIPSVIREHKVSLFPSPSTSFDPSLPYVFSVCPWNLPRLLRDGRLSLSFLSFLPSPFFPRRCNGLHQVWSLISQRAGKSPQEPNKGTERPALRRSRLDTAIFAGQLFAKVNPLDARITVIPRRIFRAFCSLTD